MSATIDIPGEEIRLLDPELAPADTVRVIGRLVEVAQDVPEDARPVDALADALGRPDFMYPNHALAGLAELASAENQDLADRAMNRLLEVCEGGSSNARHEAVYQLAKVVREGSEAEADRALTYLASVAHDPESHYATVAIQALGNARAALDSERASRALDIVEEFLTGHGPKSRIAYEAICFQASEPNPGVAGRVEQIKRSY